MRRVVWLVAAVALTAAASFAQCDGTPVRYKVRVPFGEGDTQEQLRNAAKQQAQREIIEQFCGSTIESTTVVEDSMVASDRVIDVAHGLITSLRLISKGRPVSVDLKDKPGESVTMFEIEVEATPMKIQGAPDTGFVVRAAMDKNAYSDGDPASLRVSVSKSAYLYIFNVATDGSVAMLFPNRLMEANEIAPGQDFQFPPADGPQMKMAVLGTQKSKNLKEFMIVVATKKKLDMSGSNIKQAVGRPLSLADTGNATELANLLLKLKADEIAQTAVGYELFQRAGQDVR